MNAQNTVNRRPGWWYPYIFVGLFVVVITVNGLMAYFATSTFTGLETKDAYLKGLAYNQNIAMAKAQQEMGWTVETNLTPLTENGAPKAQISIRYLDRTGKPVEGLEVNAMVVRPTIAGYDHRIQLQPLAAGTYGGVFALPLNGQWSFDFIALGADVSYQHEKRLVIP
jgi:nitrogen fixation protein FixH